MLLMLVALRKESVDRNWNLTRSNRNKLTSLSARRAWIEILTDDVSTGGKIVALRKESVDRNRCQASDISARRVALRKESVDRNHVPKYHRILPRRSLSARRAWIEIEEVENYEEQTEVALRKESVDRNTILRCLKR